MFARGLSSGILLVALVGCEMQYIDGGYTCANPEKGHIGSDGLPDPCHYQDAPDAGDGLQCAAGELVHAPLQWALPTLLWIGPEEQVPECPLGPATTAYEGHADLVAPNVCETCTCEPPTGVCALPSTLTVSTTACSMPGGSTTSFNAPAPWDGHCDNTTQVPTGAASSLTIAPLTLAENGCMPGLPLPAKVAPLHWNTYARACDVGWPSGPVERSRCVSRDSIPPGFKLCIFHDGEEPCSDATGNVFIEQHVFYKGVEDDRQCSACTCNPPTGSACTATISIYKGNDLTCSGPTFAQNTISSAGPVCLDIALPGQALGSKSAGPTTYLPGTCQSMGGDASGSATKTKPATLCCRPD